MQKPRILRVSDLYAALFFTLNYVFFINYRPIFEQREKIFL